MSDTPQNSGQLSLVTSEAKPQQGLDVLVEEYKLVQERAEGFANRLLEVIGGGVGILGVISGFVFAYQASLPIAVAWLAPLAFYMFFALLLQIVYYQIAAVWMGRLLSERINSAVGESALVTFEPGLPEYEFFSSTRGSAKVRLVYVIFLFGSVLLFALVVSVAFSVIYRDSHIGGTLFVSIYGALTLMGLVATSGFYVDLPNYYRRFINSLYTDQPGIAKTAGIRLGGSIARIPRGYEIPIHARPNIGIREAFELVIPRPADAIVKGQWFWFGFALALLTTGIHASQLPILNALFNDTSSWVTTSAVPFWAILALGVAYWLVEELLLQQAKLIWDDIRDYDRDRRSPLNRRRPIARGVISRRAAIPHMAIRWMLAFVLGYFLGGWVLVALFAVISLHQAFYVLVAKPMGRRLPLVPLIVLSVNISLRLLAGAMVVAGTGWATSPIILLFALLYFASFGGMAALWRMEADWGKRQELAWQAANPNAASSSAVQAVSPEATNVAKGEAPQPLRPQGYYYLGKRGQYWQHVGLVGAVLLSLGILAIHWAAIVYPTSVPLVREWYGYLDLTGMHYINLDLQGALTLIGCVIGFILIVTMIIVAIVHLLGPLAVFVFATIAVIFWLFTTSCTENLSLWGYVPGGCDSSTASESVFNAFWRGDARTIAIVIGTTTIATVGIVLMSRFTNALLGGIFRKTKGIILVVLLALLAYIYVVTLVNADVWLAFVSFLVLNIIYLVSYEGMTLEEYALVDLLEIRLPALWPALYCYFFRPDVGIGLRALIGILVGPIDEIKQITTNQRHLMAQPATPGEREE